MRLSMLDAVNVDAVEEKSIVAIRPKPAFRPIFEVATTRQVSDVVLIYEPPPTSNEPEAADLSFWRPLSATTTAGATIKHSVT